MNRSDRVWNFDTFFLVALMYPFNKFVFDKILIKELLGPQHHIKINTKVIKGMVTHKRLKKVGFIGILRMAI